MMYAVTGVLSFIAGSLSYAWWIKPDVRKLRREISKLNHDKNRLAAYILKEAKFKAYRNGTEIDIDE